MCDGHYWSYCERMRVIDTPPNTQVPIQMKMIEPTLLTADEVGYTHTPEIHAAMHTNYYS